MWKKWTLYAMVFASMAGGVLKVNAQSRTVQQEGLTWLRYFAHYKVNTHWQFTGELEGRFFDRHFQLHQLLSPRVNGIYSFNSHVQLAAGVTYFEQALPADPDAKIALYRPEWRPSQAVMVNQQLGNVKTQQRLMVEERWIRKTNGTELRDVSAFHFRIRYSWHFAFPLGKAEDTPWFLVLNDEVMLNAGKQVATHVFDQNRAFLAIDRKLGAKQKIEAGYMNWYQQLNSGGTDYALHHIIRITFHQYFGK